MTIRVTCTGCGRTLNVPDTSVGHKVRCPYCTLVQIAHAPAAPAGGDSSPLTEFALQDLAAKEPPPEESAPPPLPGRSDKRRRRFSQAAAPAGDTSRFTADCLSSFAFGLKSIPRCIGTLLCIAGMYMVLAVPTSCVAMAGSITVIPLGLGYILLDMAVLGFFLLFFLNAGVSAYDPTADPPPIPEIRFGELAAAFFRGLGLWLVYVAPIITLPLLPLGVLGLAQTRDGRAYDLIWAIRTAFKHPGRLALLWVFLLGLFIAGNVVMVLMVVMGVQLVGALMGGMGLSERSGVILLIPAVGIGVVLFGAVLVATLCGMCRCTGFLGKHSPDILDSLPKEPNIGKSLGFVCAGAALSFFVGCLWAGSVVASIEGESGFSLNPFAGMRTARNLAMQAQCKTNLSKIGMAIGCYSAANRDQFPPTLDDLVKEGYLNPDQLVCQTTKHPAPTLDRATGRLNGQVDYVYLGGRSSWSAGVIICYEPPSSHRRQVNVLYADLHVGDIAAAEFDSELSDSRRYAAAHPLGEGPAGVERVLAGGGRTGSVDPPAPTPMPTPMPTPEPTPTPLAMATPRPTPAPLPTFTPRAVARGPGRRSSPGSIVRPAPEPGATDNAEANSPPPPILPWTLKPDVPAATTMSATAPADPGRIKPNLSITFPIKGSREVVVPNRPSRFLLTTNKGTDGGWEVWDLQTGAKINGRTGTLEMNDLALAPDGFLVGGTRKTEAPGDPAAAEVWSLRTQKLITHVEGVAGFLPAKVLGFAGGDRVLVFHQNARREGFVRIHEMVSGKQTVELPASGAQAFRLSPTGAYLAMCDGNQFVFFSCDTGQRCGNILMTEWSYSGQTMPRTTFAGAALSPDGREFTVLYSATGAARVAAYDMGSGAKKVDLSFADAERRGNGQIDCMPDGSGWLVFGDVVMGRTGTAPRYSFPKVDNVLFSRMATPEQLLQVVATNTRLVFQTLNMPKAETPRP